MSAPRLITALLILTLLGAPDSSGERRRATGLPTLERVSASVLAAPQPVIANGIPHIAWEVLLRNDRSEEITVTTVDVIAAGGIFATYSGSEIRILNLPVRTPSLVIRAG